MLGGLFKSKRGLAAEDCVWADDAARWTGLRKLLKETLRDRGVLLLVRSGAGLDQAIDAFAELRPLAITDGYAFDDAYAQLRDPGKLLVALTDVAERRTPAGLTLAPAVHILSRSERRITDARLMVALQRWHAGPLVFHSSLDDALLRPHVDSLEPLLERLGMDRSEPIASPLIGPALQRAQRD